LEQTKWAGNVPIDKLDSHRRGEDARQGQQHEPEEHPIKHHSPRRLTVVDHVHGSNTSDRGKELFLLNLKPWHPEPIVRTVDFPHEQEDAQG
jgi:hypothetical protein